MAAGKGLWRCVLPALFGAVATPLFAQTHFIDLSKACNRSLGESFDEKFPGIPDLEQKNGLKSLPVGNQTFRGIPFQVLDPDKNQGRSLIALKGRHKPDFPEGVSIPAGNLKVPFLYFLHTCRWGGTAPDIIVAEYDIVYEDGQVTVVPLRVGVELTNFFGSDDTASSYLAWWHKYKNTEMGVNLFPWKNPRPDKGIQSILFKSRGSMPVPILLAITASDKELKVSDVSPKPEKTFQTDTSKWIPFEPSDASPVSTAIDMSFLLDAPAGKHGNIKTEGEKLVFEDGTPAQFWGVRINHFPTEESEIELLADQLAKLGCNLVCSYMTLDPHAPLKSIEVRAQEIFNAKGIYVLWRMPLTEPMDSSDLRIFPVGPGVLYLISAKWLEALKVLFQPTPTKEKAPIVEMDQMVARIGVDRNNGNTPQVMDPKESFLNIFAEQRIFGAPFFAFRDVPWPSEYLSEDPYLFSVYSVFEGWACSVGGYYMNDRKFPSLIAGDNDQAGNPTLLIQWPIAALAYLRGDLKEGKVFVLGKDGNELKALAHKSGVNPEGGKFKTDVSGQLKAKVNPKTKSFVSDTGQISWQGNVGVVQVNAPRFQALIGFLGHRKFNNAYWAVETSNEFASISAISLVKKPLNTSDHLLLTGVTRMENTGMVYNAAKTKLMNAGKAPILVEPLNAKIVLYRFQKDPKLKVRALDATGHPLATKVWSKWVKNNLVFSWVPSAFYLEIFR